MPSEESYGLEEFVEDMNLGLEMQFIFSEKEYSLSSTDEEYVFTDISEQNTATYSSYRDLLNSIRIQGYSIEEILEQRIYQDWYVY